MPWKLDRFEVVRPCIVQTWNGLAYLAGGQVTLLKMFVGLGSRSSLVVRWRKINENQKYRFYRENSTRRANFCSPRFFSFFGEKLPKSFRITLMVTSNGGHSLHHHLRHSVWLSNSLLNRRTTKPTFTQWPRKPPHCSSPPSGPLGHLFPPQRTEYSLFRLSMFWICPDQYWLSRSRTRINQKKPQKYPWYASKSGKS